MYINSMILILGLGRGKNCGVSLKAYGLGPGIKDKICGLEKLHVELKFKVSGVHLPCDNAFKAQLFSWSV